MLGIGLQHYVLGWEAEDAEPTRGASVGLATLSFRRTGLTALLVESFFRLPSECPHAELHCILAWRKA